MTEGERFRITLTLTVPTGQDGASFLALRWIVIRLVDAIHSAPFPIKVRVERDT